jgi:hypothetical protein
LRFHLPLLIGVAVCAYAGWFELSRARAGHTIAWVYAFEWPGFAIVGIFIWWRTITNAPDSRPDGAASVAPDHDMAADDPELAAWQQYLAEVQRRERSHETDAAE